MVPVVVTWSEDDAVRQEVIANSSKAVALFDELCSRLSHSPSMVEFAMGLAGRALAVGAGRSETVVTYQSSLDPPYFISAGDPRRSGEIPFEYAAQTTPYAAFNAIALSEGRAALIAYLASGELPAGIDWERL
jgi:hypothetical protein